VSIPRPDPIDAAHADPTPVASVQIAAHRIPVFDLASFQQANTHRVTSFVTNFGNWKLPSAVADALGSDRCHLEWVHDTWELTLLGGVPHLGTGSAEVPAGAGEMSGLTAGAVGGTVGAVTKSPDPGAVRELFREEQLPAGARLVILGRIEHGPRAHEALWGWHEHYRHDDGWSWLVDRLVHVHVLDAEDESFL
jgi:hypothetical protein